MSAFSSAKPSPSPPIKINKHSHTVSNFHTAAQQHAEMIYCNNCGKPGHTFHQCKGPITSIGIIAFRIVDGTYQYLMIRRRDTLGYIDFMRGKYSVSNRPYILNMLKQMTRQEKEWLRTESFETLWRRVWGNNALSSQYRSEEIVSKEKYLSLYAGVYSHSSKHALCRSNDGHIIDPPPGISTRFLYSLHTLLDESNGENTWEEPEWGFPKGRRNYHETDFDCARREFFEETGMSLEHLHHIDNILPFEEIFMGSNYKSYKHKYYLMCLKPACSEEQYPHFQKTEVSKMEWKTYDECMECIRSYNLEKKRLLTKIHTCLTQYQLCVI